MGRTVLAALAACLMTTPATAVCAGDCDGDRAVTIAEWVRVVAVVPGDQGIAACPTADGNGDGAVAVEEAVDAVRAAVAGCPVSARPPFTVASDTPQSFLDGPALAAAASGCDGPTGSGGNGTRTACGARRR